MSEPTPLTTRTDFVKRNEQLALNPHQAGMDVRSAFSQYSYDDYGTDQRRLHLRDYWHTLRKHLWLVIGISALIPTLVAIYLIRKPDVFEAQARIQVDLETLVRI
jgi:hypothetical protein